MCRDWYMVIKSALSFQSEDESTGQQDLRKIGLLLDQFCNACETPWNPFWEILVDEMIVLLTGLSKWKFERQPKPTPAGLKLLCLACPRTGYLVSFILDKKGESTVEEKVNVINTGVVWYSLKSETASGCTRK